MSKTWLSMVFVGILVPCLSFSEAKGEFEAEVRQGDLNRLASSWRPTASEEARWWWRPETGGSAWVKIGWFQMGPLRSVAGKPGVRLWAPAAYGSSGQWGGAFETPLGGLWAVQHSDTFEAGGQLELSKGFWSAAAGLDRTWGLTAEGGVSDRGRVGLSWSAPGWRWGAGGEGQLVTGGLGSWEANTKAGTDFGPFEAELKAAYGSASWNARARASWAQGLWGCSLIYDKDEGSQARASVSLDTAFAVWKLSGGARRARVWTVDGGLSAATSGASRWLASWTVTKDDGPLAQHLSGLWKQPTWEAEVSWKVEGYRLGWIGPGSTLSLIWRSFF